MSKLTPQQITTCTTILEQLEPGFLPLEIFNQIARLVRLPVVDVVPIKHQGPDLNIGLLKRETNDLWWPNMWHLPGTVFRSTDTLDGAIKRLLDDELLVQKSSTPIFRGFSVQQSKRGAEVVFIYTIEDCLFKENAPIEWFPVGKLPKDLISSERKVIDKIRESLNLISKQKI